MNLRPHLLLLAATAVLAQLPDAPAHPTLWNRVRRAVFGEPCPLAPGILEPGALEFLLTDRPPSPATGCQVSGIVGQHIATELVPYLVTTHLRDPAPRKPLVLAFVGTTGVGKTEFERQLRRAVLAGAHPDGLAAGALVLSGNDFRDATAGPALHHTLRDRVARQVWSCPHSLVVVDEVQFVADGVLDALVDLLGFQQPVVVEPYGAVDFRRATVILTSMDGGVAALAMPAMERGERAKLKLGNFSAALRANLAKKARWLALKSLVDYYVPFLPVSAEHVALAAQRQLEAYNCSQVRAGTLAALTWDAAVVEHVATSQTAADGLARDGLGGVGRALAVDVFRLVAAALRAAGPTPPRLHVSVAPDTGEITVRRLPPPPNPEL